MSFFHFSSILLIITPDKVTILGGDDMFSYLNPIPLINHFRAPSTETAQAAISFLSHSGDGLASMANKAQYVFAVTLTLSLLMASRSKMMEDETAYSKSGEMEAPVSPLYVFSRFLFCIALISGFSYLNCKAGSMLANHAVNWIKPPFQ